MTLLAMQDANQFFQQALLKETGEGDLKSAVAIYEKIIKDETADRSLRAQAQLHIGLCWEKMDKTEAKSAYQTILDNYKDQPEIVQQAKDRMNKIMNEEMEKNRSLHPQYIKLLETEGNIVSADYSPDARWIVYQVHSYQQRSLWLMNNETKLKKEILTNIPLGAVPCVRWSPAGNSIAYLAANESLNILPIDIKTGAVPDKPRTLIKRYITGFDWHPTGEKLCFNSISTQRDSLKCYDITTSQTKLMFSWENNILNPIWSENGDAIYFMAHGTSGNNSWDIFRFDILSGKVEQKVEGYALLGGMDDSSFLASREVINPPAMTLVNLQENSSLKLNLRPELTHSIIVNFSPDGMRLLLPSRRKQYRVSQLDIDTKTVTETAYPSLPIYSPSKRYLAFEGSNGENHSIHVRNLTNSVEKLFPVESYTWLKSWSPDENRIIYNEMSKKTLNTLNVQSGNTEILDSYDKEIWETLTFSWDGSKLAYPISKNGKYQLAILDVATNNKKNLRSNPEYISSVCWIPNHNGIVFTERTGNKSKLIRYNLIDDNEMILYTDSLHIGKPVLSLDGESVAFVLKDVNTNYGQIYILDMKNGVARPIWPDDPVGIEQILWHSNEKLIIAESWDKGWNKTNIYIIPTTGEPASSLEISNSDGFLLHPDGKSLLFEKAYIAGGALWELIIPETNEL